MTTRRGRFAAARWVALGCAALLAAAGCSNVPNSSAPQVVKSVGPAEQPAPPLVTPEPGADPTTIVSQFLQLNVSGRDDKHQGAKQFLTAAARNRWSDSTATVVSSFQVAPTMNPKSHVVTVTAVKVGSLAANGIYTPVSQSDGTASETIRLDYTMAQVNGQWRIDKPPQGAGLVVPATELSTTQTTAYQLHALYFTDVSGKRLVADPRYSALHDQALANWLLAQLIAGPRQELASAVLPLPDQLNAKAASVVASDQLTAIEIPGSSALDKDTLRRLAAQLANTFVSSVYSSVEITDNGRPVDVPGVGTTFTANDFTSAGGPLTDPALWYLNGSGRVASGSTGQVIDGPLGHQNYGLDSIALALHGSSSNYLAAGVTGPERNARLLVGTVNTGLHDSGLRPGWLTRPAWVSDHSEVWVGDGAKLIRLPYGKNASVVPVSLPGGSISRIRALRFSPNGVRVALVIVGTDGSSIGYVGTVERGGSSVRIDNLLPVTPAGTTVTDMDWNNEFTLYVSGSTSSTYNVWQVQDDGSAWSDRNARNLPAAPDSITAAPGALPWVSANGAVYRQDGNSWVSPPFQPANVVAQGTSPCYLE